MKRKLVLFILLGFFLAQLGYAAPAIAAGNSIYVSSSTQSVTKDSTFTVLLRMTSGAAIKTVQANLSYPSSQMTYLSTAYSATAFEEGLEEWGGGGSVVISRRAASTVTGDQLVAMITFKAIVASGTGTISVQNSSALTSTEPITATYGSTAISFTPMPGTTEPIVTIPTKAQATSTSTLPADTAPPIITHAKSEQTALSSQTISWATNEISSSYVEYGINTQYGLTASDNALVTAHKITLNSAFLLPNLKFHYRITSVDASGNTQHSSDLTFTTTGITYTITVLDKHGRPLPDAIVYLSGQTVYTDDDGKASLGSLPGKQAVTIKYNGTTMSKIVTVGSDKTQQIDTIELAADRRDYDTRFFIYPALVLLGLVIGIGSRIRVRKYLLAAIKGERTSLVSLPISSMQKVFGDANPAHNPYRPKHRFSIWSLPNFLLKPFHHKNAAENQPSDHSQRKSSS